MSTESKLSQLMTNSRLAEHLAGPDYAQMQMKRRSRSGDSEEFPDAGPKIPDLVCFSHLRWDFVYQRPQHLLTRCARDRRVFFVEEPIFGNGSMRLDVQEREGGVQVVVPHLPEGLRSEVATTAVMKEMMRRLFSGARYSRIRFLVLHANGAELYEALFSHRLRLRLHGRAFRVQRSALAPGRI